MDTQRAAGGSMETDDDLLRFIESDMKVLESYPRQVEYNPRAPSVKEEPKQVELRPVISQSLKDWIDEGCKYEVPARSCLPQSEVFDKLFVILSNADPLQRSKWLPQLKNGIKGMSKQECAYLQEMFGNVMIGSASPAAQLMAEEVTPNAEDERTKKIAALKQEYFKARDERKQLYELYGSGGYGNGDHYYHMLPRDTLSIEEHQGVLRGYEQRQKEIETTFELRKSRLTPCLNFPSFAPARGTITPYTPEQIKDILKPLEDDYNQATKRLKSERLTFLQTRQPIDKDAFFAKLHPLLDTMADTLAALREFQAQGVDIGEFEPL